MILELVEKVRRFLLTRPPGGDVAGAKVEDKRGHTRVSIPGQDQRRPSGLWLTQQTRDRWEEC